MSIRTQVLRVNIPNVRPYGFPPRMTRCGQNDNGVIHGHEFDFEVELKFTSHGTFGRDKTLHFDERMLSWGEEIRWYEPNPLGPDQPWVAKGDPDVVDFADDDYNYRVKTVRVGWFGGSREEPGWFLPWVSRPWRDLSEPIVAWPNPNPRNWDFPTQGNMQGPEIMSRKLDFAKWLVKKKGGKLVTILTDRPALTKQCSKDDGSWQNSGGGGMRTLNRHSRRRVVMFTLSAGGNTATATQILETQAGTPTICKFIIPGITLAESRDQANLAKWRNELDLNDANNFTTTA